MSEFGKQNAECRLCAKMQFEENLIELNDLIISNILFYCRVEIYQNLKLQNIACKSCIETLENFIEFSENVKNVQTLYQERAENIKDVILELQDSEKYSEIPASMEIVEDLNNAEELLNESKTSAVHNENSDYNESEMSEESDEDYDTKKTKKKARQKVATKKTQVGMKIANLKSKYITS